LLASGLTAVLMAGLGSVFVVSALALPASGKVEVDLLAASRVAGRIAAEASYATRINAATKTVLDFEVADRNSDGAVESIRYEWGGNAGDALKRAMNGSAASDVLENVRDADFSLTTVPEVIASGGGGEILLFKCDGGTRGSSAVSGANCRGQFFAPWLPAGAAAWRPTRVLLRLGQNGPGDSKVTVNVKESLVTLLPGLVQLGTVTICEAALPATPGWVECAFPHAVWALAATNGCVEIKMGTGGNYATIEFGQNVTISGGAILSSSTNGALWGSTPTSQLCIQVYGEATTLGTVAGTTLDAVLGGGSTTRTLATRLDVSVAAGPESALGTAAAVMVNRPEVP
jgi:hypothetical protein